jgi:hypothetical protein
MGQQIFLKIISNNFKVETLGGVTPSYVLHTCALRTSLLGGVIYFAEKIIRYNIFQNKGNACILIHPIINYILGNHFKIPYCTYIGTWVEIINSTLDTLVQ